jgi:hypothetical protein
MRAAFLPAILSIHRMFDFNSLLHFSHHYCVAICAVLVPLNLLATLQTLIFAGLNRPFSHLWKSAILAIACATFMILHVLTWFIIGVVMLQTFVLLSLAAVCLGINLWALGYPDTVGGLLRGLVQTIKQVFQNIRQGVEA